MTDFSHASEFVTDTMGLILRIEQRKMGSRAESIFDLLESGSAIIHVPAMVFAEMLYLSEKQRISLSFDEISDYLRQFPNCKEYPMSFAVIRSAAEISDIPELHDRLIAGTARLLNLDLITNDRVIQASNFVRVVW